MPDEPEGLTLPSTVRDRWRVKVSEGGIDVTLGVDMARYHPALVEGAKGRTLPPLGRSSFGVNRYVRVAFNGIEEPVDVLWRDLVPDDAAWTRWREEERAAIVAALEGGAVASARLQEGARGGFQRLEVCYNNGRLPDVWHRVQEARPVLAKLRAMGHLPPEEPKS